MDKLVISRYGEDVSWLKEYNFEHVIYNKGDDLDSAFNCIRTENVGENQRDIFRFIVNNYNDLPNSVGFVQANPFDHCKKETFDVLIKNNTLTRLEDYNYLVPTFEVGPDGLYQEINNNLFIDNINRYYNQTCQYNTFDSFMCSIFKNYSHVEIINFSPGSQIIVERERILFYPLNFWKYLEKILIRRNMTEGHIIERSLFLIFSNIYQVREEILDGI